MNSKDKGIIITISVVLGTTLLATFIALIVFICTTKTYSTQLENLYKRSFYELSTNINDIELDMSKLVAVNDTKSKREVLTNIYNSCESANTNISNLPIQSNKIDKVNNFINVLGGYSYSLLTKTNNNTEFSNEDYDTIYDMHARSLELLYEFNEYISNLKIDYSILKNIDYSNGDKSKFDGGLGAINSSSSEVPTLIYDGPFSESVVNKAIKGLDNFEIDATEAKEYVTQTLSFLNVESVEYVNETNGKFYTYNFNVKTANQSLYVQVTKRGSKIVNITSYGANGDKDLSEDECITLAENFGTLLEYENLKCVWSATNGNICYVNLAPIVSGVIYYPDLVKVKVDKVTGTIVGLEGTNYCYNHISRNHIAPALSFDAAQSGLSKALTVKERNLSLIPNKYVGETYAYEFVCTWKDYTYYVYIDIQTGEEVNILRVVKTTSGDLIV